MPNLDSLKLQAQHLLDILVGWLSSPQFYAQVIAIIAAVLIGRIAAKQILAKVFLFNTEPTEGKLLRYRTLLYSMRDLLRPALVVVALAAASAVCDAGVGSSWLVRLASVAATISLLVAVIKRFVKHPIANAGARWIGLPVAAVYMFGYMPQLLNWLDTTALQAGNIRISLLAVIKAAVFGGIFFAIGRMSSNAGQKVIRDQQSVDIQTRELAAKALELIVFGIVFLLLFNVLGLDLSTLAVLGGAVGVGIGFGLQQIASNFISGIIILLERSIKVGDYIELEDGRTGLLREISMRSSRLETFDGKDIMVPNERFITTRFVNWTKSDPRQRYEVPFVVAYETDLHKIPSLIEKAVSSHETVLQVPEKVSCELKKFGDFGAHFSVKFWVNGIDDGPNNFTSDVHFLVWDALQNGGIKMATPHHQVAIIGADNLLMAKAKSK
jgi:small-conductance mechanosensitive channel